MLSILTQYIVSRSYNSFFLDEIPLYHGVDK